MPDMATSAHPAFTHRLGAIIMIAVNLPVNMCPQSVTVFFPQKQGSTIEVHINS